MPIAWRRRTSRRSRAKRSRGRLRLAGSPQRYLWSSMLGQMAKYDPDQALQIAQSADSPAQRAQAMGKVLAAIAQTDPSMAMDSVCRSCRRARCARRSSAKSPASVATLAPTDGARLAQRHRRRHDAARSGAVARLGAVAAQRRSGGAARRSRSEGGARELDHGCRARLCGVRRREGPSVGAPLRQ